MESPPLAAHYLPQWSSREAAAARYRLGDGTLRLLSEPTSRRGARSSTARPRSPRSRPGCSPARSAARSVSTSSSRRLSPSDALAASGQARAPWGTLLPEWKAGPLAHGRVGV